MSLAISIGYMLLMLTQVIWIFQFGIQHHEFNSESNDCRVFVTSPYRNSTPLVYRNNLQSYPDRESDMHSSTESENTVYLSPHVNYSIPVTALHDYEGNKSDPNELSFSKGETMYVYEKSGSWWQAKKISGEIGVIPSNYVCL